MQDCWQKSTAAGFIREEMIAAIESDTGKTCNLSLSVASDNKPSLKINCTENLVTVRKKDQNILKVPYYFNIENAVLNIANGSAVRSGLNVDLEYYSQNNVNIVIMLTSDGEEYLPSSTLEEAQKMADEYVPDVSESENEDFEDTPPSEY